MTDIPETVDLPPLVDATADASPAPGAPRRPTRAELDRIFGTEQTSTSDDLPEPEAPRSGDDWFYENRPPHHG